MNAITAATAALLGWSLVAACQRKPPTVPRAAPASVSDALEPAGPVSATVYDPAHPFGPEEPAVEPPPPPPPPPTPTAEAGHIAYERYCALCHGRDAKGYAADNAPSLVSSTFLESATDEFLVESITLGRPGTAMAGYGSAIGGPLPPDQVKSLVLFLRDKGPEPRQLVRRSAVGDPSVGEALYRANCANCHGSVRQRGEAVHLFNPQLLASADDRYLRYAVENGRPGTRMAAWRKRLSSQQVDAILSHLRHSTPPLPVRAVHPAPAAGEATATAMAVGSDGEDLPTPLPPTPKPTTPVVLNPDGGAPQWQLREGRFVSVDAVAKAMAAKRRIIVLDARAPSDYALLHIVGAIVTPYYDRKSLDVVPNDGTWAVAYCACPHHVSGEVVDELKRRGHTNAAVLDEGIFVWNARGYPVVKDPNAPEPPIPPPGFPFVQAPDPERPASPVGNAKGKRRPSKTTAPK